MEIVNIERESSPAVRFIGRKYPVGTNYGAMWGQWFGTGLFEPLEALGNLAPIGQDSYCGAMHIVNGELEYWIGLFFEPGVEAPEGYESVDLPALDFAVCYIKDKPESPDLFGLASHNRCLEAMTAQGFTRKEDDWCFERYQCPRYTTPDAEGNVILDYAIAIEA